MVDNRRYLPTYRIAMENDLTFITNNGARMRYASLRDAGFRTLALTGVGPAYLASYFVAAILAAVIAYRTSGVPLRWSLIAWTGAIGASGLAMIWGTGVFCGAASAVLLLLVSWRFGGLDAIRQVARRVRLVLH